MVVGVVKEKKTKQNINAPKEEQKMSSASLGLWCRGKKKKVERSVISKFGLHLWHLIETIASKHFEE